MENAVRKQKTILFVGRIHQPGPIHGDNPTHAAPSVSRCRVGPGACVAHQSATALSPWARLSGDSPPNSLLAPARNPAVAAPIWSAHHPLVAAAPARLHAPLSPSCPLRVAEPSPLSAAPACTLPLLHHDLGRSRSRQVMHSRPSLATACHLLLLHRLGTEPSARAHVDLPAICHLARTLCGAATSVWHLTHFPTWTPTQGQGRVGPCFGHATTARWPPLHQLQGMRACAHHDVIIFATLSADSPA
jgi:hypothetical protein